MNNQVTYFEKDGATFTVSLTIGATLRGVEVHAIPVCGDLRDDRLELFAPNDACPAADIFNIFAKHAGEDSEGLRVALVSNILSEFPKIRLISLFTPADALRISNHPVLGHASGGKLQHFLTSIYCDTAHHISLTRIWDMERSHAISTGEDEMTKADQNAGPFVLPEGGCDLNEVERGLLWQAMSRTANNQTKAAKLLGITRYALRYRLVKFGFVGLRLNKRR